MLWPAALPEHDREATRRVVRGALVEPGAPFMVAPFQHRDRRRALAVIGDTSIGDSGAVRGSLYVLAPVAQVDVVAGLQAAPMVFTHHPYHPWGTAAVDRLLPAIVELVTAAAETATASGGPPTLTWDEA